jgi:hypothetical protein
MQKARLAAAAAATKRNKKIKSSSGTTTNAGVIQRRTTVDAPKRCFPLALRPMGADRREFGASVGAAD